MVNPSMQMAVAMVIPGVHVLRHSDGGSGSCLSDTPATRLQTAAEQEYETTGSEETLKTVIINTDWGLPYLPRASMEQRKVNCLSSGQSQFLPAVCRMALISLWRQ